MSDIKIKFINKNSDDSILWSKVVSFSEEKVREISFFYLIKNCKLDIFSYEFINADFRQESFDIFCSYFSNETPIPNFSSLKNFDSRQEMHKQATYLIEIVRICRQFGIESLKEKCLIQISKYMIFLVYFEGYSSESVYQYLNFWPILGRKEFVDYCHQKGIIKFLSDFVNDGNKLSLLLGKNIDEFTSFDSFMLACKISNIKIEDYLIMSKEKVRNLMKEYNDYIFNLELPIGEYDQDKKMKILRYEFHISKINKLKNVNCKLLTPQEFGNQK